MIGNKLFKRLVHKLIGMLGLELRRKTTQIDLNKDCFNLNNLGSACFNEFRAASIAASSPSDSIVIIGAHDLLSFDSVVSYLRSCKSQVFCFEPRPASYRQLSDNIEKLGLTTCIPVNKAVHPSLRECIIYDISQDYISCYPSWAQGIASFSRLHILKTAAENHIKEEVVPCSSPDNWSIDYKIKSISYLQIDTEGYDWEILKSINLYSFAPIAIMMEYVNLRESEKNECCVYLKDHGYDLMFNGEDVLAVKMTRLLQYIIKNCDT